MTTERNLSFIIDLPVREINDKKRTPTTHKQKSLELNMMILYIPELFLNKYES